MVEVPSLETLYPKVKTPSSAKVKLIVAVELWTPPLLEV